MRNFKAKLAIFVGIPVAIILGLTTLAVAATVSAAPVKAYGICVAKTGAVRVLEAKALAKSRHGKCKTGEQRVLVPSTDGVPAAINGKSAYQLWVAQPGNAGKTEAAFLASLKGDTGKDGAKGDKGEMPAEFKMTFTGDPATYTCKWEATPAPGKLACTK